MTTLLSEMREPPVIGRFYLVPVVPEFFSYGVVRDWPVIGPLHEGAEFFNFRELHYHVDLRFVGERDFRRIANWARWRAVGRGDAARAALGASVLPVNDRRTPLPKGRLPLMWRKCRRAAIDTPLLEYVPLIGGAMEARYGSPAPAICLRDGRKLCPHRKADLSSFPPDADGIVVCPLHGLRVKVSGGARGQG